ncbi:MAG: Hpt domain-containing protein [Lachnospiraceae bacterium]
MGLEECYAAFGGSYEKVKGYLRSDALIRKFVVKFLSDPSYESLCESLEKEDYGEAFRAAHTLKGVCQNLCFKRLSESAALLTEALRDYESGDIDKAYCLKLQQNVTTDYEDVVNAIRGLN